MKPASSKCRLSPSRRWLFRVAAVLLGLLPLLVLEVLFSLIGWPNGRETEDPFVGFSEIRPLFTLNDETDRYEIAADRLGYFRPDGFAKEKGENEYRIFCLGGSTVQGRPFAIETSFTTWLEIALNASDPSRQWEVVNGGGVSYASYRLRPILDEVLGYEPDMILLYTGHNEFLEDRTYAHIKHLPKVVATGGAWLARLRTFAAAQVLYDRLRGRTRGAAVPGRPELEAEVDAMLEYRGGLEKYHRDPKWQRDVIAHFRHNLDAMIRAADEAGVPLLLADPVCNLRDCGPFKAEHRADLTPEEETRWKDLFLSAGKCLATDPDKAIDLLEKAREIDDQHAGLHFALAKCYDGQGRMEEALASYLRAKDLDVCPLRILEPMREEIDEAAHQGGVTIVGVRRLFEGLSPEGIPGDYLMLDHVHPSIAGHQLIAKLYLDQLIHMGIVQTVADWRTRSTEAMNRHYDSLDSLYFAEGQERLEMLRGWTQGKATQEPPAPLRPAADSP